MNVSELARQLRTTREELLAKLPELGFDIGGRAIKVDNQVAERIRQAWSQSQRKERIVAKMQVQQERAEAVANRETLGREIAIPDKITVSQLAEKLGQGVPHLIGYLMKNGIMASLNQQIDFDTATLVAEDYGFKVTRAQPAELTETEASQNELRNLKQEIASDKDAVLRPPVVVVMGHVDHGKTTLLDAIRQTNVVAGEAGGITQHIGAYQVEEKGRRITFLDTPGHEAFKAMRARGGQVADVAILVVAADDGLKPQTLESINVIQKENLPFVVAINKIDKPGADIDKVKKELSEVNMVPEDWGGKTICVPVSAKQRLHIPELLDMVLLVADMEKFSANPNRDALGVIIESHIDRGEGPVATVLVTAGTLRNGDEVVIGDTFGKIKALKDWRGANTPAAAPATPVKILGLKSAPAVGDILRVEETTRSLRKQIKKNYRFGEAAEAGTEQKTVSEETTLPENVSQLTVIIKADVLGSLEALLPALKKLERQNVRIEMLKQGLGNITESDIALAESAGAVVYGFNVSLSAEARKVSYRSKVEIKTYKIIYELLDDVAARIKALVKTIVIEVPQGELVVLKVFKDSRAESIVGGRVNKAKISNKAKFRLLRNGEPIEEGKIIEIQQNRQSIDEAREGVECGFKVSGVRGIKEGDVLACYMEEERQGS
ncbi:MAG: translation initiation factor IF-2 [Candidatus Komeilibacteria bacterium RIFCSPLOWO2_02_FULL_48_11]|uniref:Translation initiation factor IF-2 n=1 Tax=Candidatus Komeilibacteria bacterium RIFCSPLOWO2_02_FULL_48_11 TaxID=1798553 RepID=A0A1G2BQP9_9BACT|nr:MAG: translation initiation factor IF-2 [Candidatus Komeilibacteria bacterium RIFCSPLOWO2_02_FULL_48_11]